MPTPPIRGESMPGRGVRIPESLRQTVVEYAQRNNLGARETARALGKPRSTVQRIMDEYKERGHCKPLPGYRRGSAGRSKEKGNLQIPSMYVSQNVLDENVCKPTNFSAPDAFCLQESQKAEE
eukprot:3328519-Rhodomonas_salina.1